MITLNSSLGKTTFLPSHTCGESEARGAEQAGGEGAFGLPGVARRLVTFLASPRQRVAVETNLQVMSEPKVTKRRRSPIRHLCEVPCVARLVRRLRNSHCVLRQSSPTPPDQPALLGGGRGEGEARREQWVVINNLPFYYACEGIL
jgi:hypothetical protein